MTPKEIRIELFKAGVPQRAIARRLKVSYPAVCQTIAGEMASVRIQAEIANVIGKSPAAVFPDRYDDRGRPVKRCLKRCAG